MGRVSRVIPGGGGFLVGWGFGGFKKKGLQKRISPESLAYSRKSLPYTWGAQ